MGNLIGLDLGGTKCLGLLVGPQGSVIGSRRASVADLGGWGAVESVLMQLIELSPSVDAVGLGMPGLVDAGGIFRRGANMTSLVDFDARTGLTSLIDVPVHVSNDASAAAFGEFVARRDLAQEPGLKDLNLVMVTFGTGIGGGVVLNGSPYFGAHGFAGEFGHMVIEESGPACVCGMSGCWEVFASGSALKRLAEGAAGRYPDGFLSTKRRAGEVLAGELVVLGANAAEPDCLEVIREHARYTSAGIGPLISMFDPHIVAIGGGLIEAGEVWLGEVRALLPSFIQPGWPQVEVAAARLGESAGAFGAAMLARDYGR